MNKSESKSIKRLQTGIPNLDAVLGGGLPERSVTVIAGPPGSGKTILSHQLGFHNSGPDSKVIYFQTLGEPTSKRLHYLGQFSYFDPEKFESSIRFIDLGILLKKEGIDSVIGLIMDHIKRERPSIVVIDSFKAFEDLVSSPEQHRKFNYEIVINLIAWECTTLLLGEFCEEDFRQNPLFSVIDGVITMTQVEKSGEQLRMLRVVKMRGTDHSRDRHPFLIDKDGIQLFAPRVTIRRDPLVGARAHASPYCRTGVADLDGLLEDGIPRGSSVMLSGVSGTGKTVVLLSFIYHGAVQFGEKGILFSFEETKERICFAAKGLGWDLEDLMQRGLIDIIFIPQPELLVEEHLLMMREKAEAMGAARIAVDSLSGFLHKIENAQMAREKVFQLTTIVQNLGAVGFFSSEIPFGTTRISRFGVEETVVDGIFILSLESEGNQRKRYFEIYKLRRAAHSLGKFPMVIEHGGFRIINSSHKAVRSGDKANDRKKKAKKKTRVR